MHDDHTANGLSPGRIALLLFLGSMLLLAVKWPFTGGGPSVAGAQRILAGEIPYRDFWTLYAPGSFYLYALLLRLAGEHLLTGVVAGSVLTSASVSAVFLLVRNWLRQTGPALAVAALLFAVSFANPYYLDLGPYPPALLLILLVLAGVNRYYAGGGLSGLFVTGLLSGLLIVFKHDVAGYTGLSIGVGMIAWHLLATGDELPQRLGALLRTLVVYGAGAALVAVPVAAWFALRAGPDMWQDLVIFPLTDFRYSRPENYPGLLPTGLWHPWKLQLLFNVSGYLGFLLPTLFALAAPLIVLAALLHRHRRHAALGITFLSAWLFHYASAHVQINTNIISMTLYGSLFAVLLYFLLRQSAGPGRRQVLDTLLLLLVTGWCAVHLVEPAYRTWQSWQETSHVLTGLPRVNGMRVNAREYRELEFLNAWLREHDDGNDYLYIGLQRHDVTEGSRCGLYFVLDRLNPTRHDQLHPGVVERADYQRQIIRDLEVKQVSTLFLYNYYEDGRFDRMKEERMTFLPQSGATVLDTWIRQNFHPVASHDRWEILRRNEPGSR